MNRMGRIASVVFSIIMYIVLPPVVISLGVSMMCGWKMFIPMFLCVFGVDLIVGYVVNEIVTQKKMKMLADLEKERMDYERGHVIGVSCSNCGQRNLVPLDLSIDAFECDKCHSTNKIFYEFRAQSVSDFERKKMMADFANQVATAGEQEAQIWDSLDER